MSKGRAGKGSETKNQKLREYFKEMGDSLMMHGAMTGLKAVPCSDFPDSRTWLLSVPSRHLRIEKSAEGLWWATNSPSGTTAWPDP